MLGIISMSHSLNNPIKKTFFQNMETGLCVEIYNTNAQKEK